MLKRNKKEIIRNFKAELEQSKTIDHLFKLEKDGYVITNKITNKIYL